LVGVITARLAIALGLPAVGTIRSGIFAGLLGGTLTVAVLAIAVAAPAPTARIAALVFRSAPVLACAAIARSFAAGRAGGLVRYRGLGRRCGRRLLHSRRGRRARLGAARLGRDIHRSKRNGVRIKRSILVVAGQAVPHA
jgi:hypothetical protein